AGEPSAAIRERVLKARQMQQERFVNTPIHSNAMMPPALVQKICVLDKASELLLQKAMQKLKLSARALDRILKVARTIADLAGSKDIKCEHVAEAIHYRSLDREGWGG
ncbi:MAG: magnesium chelatase, partial [Bacteroidia bacterium]|nr:magnesium chelatase [Bacteroidia bacterium]MDW8159533.1 magnesium chelatase [Bacteroidia bacterium]